MISDNSNNKADQRAQKLVQAVGAEAKKNINKTKNGNDIGLRVPGSNWQRFKALVTETTPSEEQTNPTKLMKRKRSVTRNFGSKSERKPSPLKFSQQNENKDVCMPQQQKENKDVCMPQQQKENADIKENNSSESNNGLTKAVAIDCEMVGIGDGQDSMIARVSIVNRYGVCIYDKYVKPTEIVQDYRTAVSGIHPHHLASGEDFKVVQKEVSKILRGRILVGHALHHDLDVLFLSHPKRSIRDTARYKVFRKVTNGSTPSLKKLASELLGKDIQSGEHNSVEDAQTAMQLYQLFRKKWEHDIRRK